MMRMMQGEESVGAWCNYIHTTATPIVFAMAMERRGSFRIYISFLFVMISIATKAFTEF